VEMTGHVTGTCTSRLIAVSSRQLRLTLTAGHHYYELYSTVSPRAGAAPSIEYSESD